MKYKIKTTELIEALATSKSILKLMGTKKNLEIPANDIGNLLGILQKIKNQDNSDNDQQANDLITQLQSINAYIIGASQDVNSIASQLRKMPDIKSKLDSQLTSESTLRNLIQLLINQQLNIYLTKITSSYTFKLYNIYLQQLKSCKICM